METWSKAIGPHCAVTRMHAKPPARKNCSFVQHQIRLSAQLIEAQQETPAAVTSLRDTVNDVRRFEAELEAIRLETPAQRYSGALQKQIMQRSRRAELARSVIRR
jgi:hypothetical protein